MELIKKNVHMNKQGGNAILSITLEDDYNVSDIKPDIEMLLKENAKTDNITLKQEEGRVCVNARFLFDVLYISKDKSNPINNISGEIPIKEYVNINNSGDSDFCDVSLIIDDINIKIINSRKISIRAIISIEVSTSEFTTNEVITDVNCDAKKLFQSERISELAIQKKDTLRIKEEINLPASKPDIGRIVYKEVKLLQREVRLIENGFNIRGEMSMFVIYVKDEDNDVMWYETTVPFDEAVSVNGIMEDMIEHIETTLSSYTLDVRPDQDGLERKLCLEAVIDFGILVYNEEEVPFLADIYDPLKEYVVNNQVMDFEKVVLKNQSKCQINDSISYRATKNNLLQLCFIEGIPRVDDSEIVEGGIRINGVLSVSAVAIMENDEEPLNIIKGQIPFSHMIQVPDINENCIFKYYLYVDKISQTLAGDNEIAVRATVVFDTLVKEKVSREVPWDITCEAVDMEKVMAQPGIIGYIVKDKETLWDVAKRYKTTVEEIMATNNKVTDSISKGEKLIIVKKVSNC